MAVTAAKLPPPPRSAQNRSGSFSASTRWDWPSAVTILIATTVLAAMPRLRDRKVNQPPSPGVGDGNRSPPPREEPPPPPSCADQQSAQRQCGPIASFTSPQIAPA